MYVSATYLQMLFTILVSSEVFRKNNGICILVADL